MNRSDFFKDAVWVGKKSRDKNTFSILRGHFFLDKTEKVTLNVIGLGFFKCYINGICINPDTFLPLSSDYQAGCDPKNEILSAHRIYVPQFDITPYVHKGDNVIAVHFGGGWYTFANRPFGLPKAIYCIFACENGNTEYFVSDESCKIGDSFVDDYYFVERECHNYIDYTDAFGTDFDDGAWENAAATEELDTQYCTTNCPQDKLIKTLTPNILGKGENGGTVYDCGENTTGYPVMRVLAPKGDAVRVIFSEAIDENGYLDKYRCHRQSFAVTSDGEERLVQPEFVWYGFRYFEVIGDAVPECIKVVYADISSASSFECDNDTLNWAYNTFIHTMLCNMHTGHPSDCPHLERRGYTGDGQVTCNAALYALDARAFYEKWLQDIADGQDVLSGHIQYTAPYINSGGGPGGWGSAIVEVPYQLYKHYGDAEILKKYYPNMRRYINYLESHSEHGLVVRDKEGAWCLGDWCGPVILYPDKEILNHRQQVFIPAPMVNTYFMIKSLQKMCEIARIIGCEDDIPQYEETIKYRRSVINAAYFNTFDSNFMMNIQGANAFALDIGLGNGNTYKNTLDHYKKLGHYDTGIFGTDILTRILFERGDCELAVELMTNDGPQGFEHWRKGGATTFHEYWDSNRSRSHSHHMFGSPVAYIFEYLLGIKQAEGSCGYDSIIIAPQATSKFKHMSGSIKTPHGIVSLGYKKADKNIIFDVVIPEGVDAVFIYGDNKIVLQHLQNTISLCE
ncbi:MAG: hypothetical protein E7312_01050 [Clostridiales bacterium]|nr:hypothetical protein [Clostridiales bacterium]